MYCTLATDMPFAAPSTTPLVLTCRSQYTHATPTILAAVFAGEVGELTRKFFLCALLRYIQPGSATQLLIGIGVCIFYLAAVAFFSPYKTSSDNLLNTVTTVSCL